LLNGTAEEGTITQVKYEIYQKLVGRINLYFEVIENN
jgi:hypothetical protein